MAYIFSKEIYSKWKKASDEEQGIYRLKNFPNEQNKDRFKPIELVSLFGIIKIKALTTETHIHFCSANCMVRFLNHCRFCHFVLVPSCNTPIISWLKLYKVFGLSPSRVPKYIPWIILGLFMNPEEISFVFRNYHMPHFLDGRRYHVWVESTNHRQLYMKQDA